MQKILISTTHKLGEKSGEGGYVATCTVDNEPLQTNPKETPRFAVDTLINFVVQTKKEQGQKRDVDYMFTTKLV